MYANKLRSIENLGKLIGPEIIIKNVLTSYFVDGETAKKISANYSIPIGKTKNIINRYNYLLKKQSKDPEIERAKIILYQDK